MMISKGSHAISQANLLIVEELCREVVCNRREHEVAALALGLPPAAGGRRATTLAHHTLSLLYTMLTTISTSTARDNC